ncbi:MAG: class I SAM-dependent methyltransferase [Patescibacteria group bacterium]
MNCVNCETQMEPYFIKRNFEIVRCPRCNLMAVVNAGEDLSKCYTEGYFKGDTTLDGYMDYDLDKEVSRKTYINILDILSDHLQKQNDISLFEVGCATGFFMDLARGRGWQTEGMDISDYAAAKAVEKGLSVTAGSFENFLPAKKYHAVVMQDLIEHVKDPVGVIKKAGEMLEQNGLLTLTTPDAGSLWARVMGKRWHAFVPPQHLFYFSATNISKMLEKSGFKIIYASHHGKWFTVPYILRLLYSWTGAGMFSRFASWTAKSFVKGCAIPINVGDTLFLVARKM